MNLADHWLFSYQALARHRLRSTMVLLAIGMGVSSVLLLTSIGEGARLYIEQEFSALGSKMLIVLPGKKETTGSAPPLYGTSPRDLTIEDAQALKKIPSISHVAPIIAGTASVSNQSLSRDIIILGTNRDMFTVRNLTVKQGRMLPENSETRATPVCILGAKLAKELFKKSSPMGQWLRIGEYKYRVIGLLKARGESLGLDLQDMAIIPVRSAQVLFDSPALFRILLQLKQTDFEINTRVNINKIIAQRHDGEADITIISQDAMLSAFNKIIVAVTASIGAIAAISLIVAGILIMNVSYISVSQRREEIGLLKSLGASAREVRQIFIISSLVITSFGSLAGLILSYSLVFIIQTNFPKIPLAIPWWSTIAAIFMSFIVALLFSWLPANKAAAVDPILALRG
ncbi:ABC transporter permease [Colwellia sp. MB02u-6]|uniref:ABC transporter permease n=1 Tax=Colwellia sp. MB02u-6 TaxID=2759824 RepID=UPI0015F6A974|nr:ABC transporter permease [Colwellia sp. MB02u-6]MBA6327263.1 ABC transporter permease [Colwellia sp. MB02u-6]